MMTSAEGHDLHHHTTRETNVTIGSYERYADAEAVVDALSDQGFPVKRTAIVARDLRYLEQVTGRKGYGRAALQGAGQTAFAGFTLGLLLSVFNLYGPLVPGLALALYGAGVGAIVGALLGLLAHAATRGRRDFSSVGMFNAGFYDVVADPEVAARARALTSGDAEPR